MVILVLNTFLISGKLVEFNENTIIIDANQVSSQKKLSLLFESKKIYNALKGKENKAIIIRGKICYIEDKNKLVLFANEVLFDERDCYDKN